MEIITNMSNEGWDKYYIYFEVRKYCPKEQKEDLSEK
jgi:hypothetical protein